MDTSNIKLALEFRQYFLDNQEIWFNPVNNYDDEITAKFGDLLNVKSINDFLKLTLEDNNCELNNPELDIAIILIFDQLPYYIYRKEIQQIRKLQKQIYTFSEYLINNKISEYSPTEQCFIMLNMRHVGRNNIDTLLFLCNKVLELRSIEDFSIYRRFYKATLLQLIKIKNNELEINYNITISNVEKDYLPTTSFTNIENIKLDIENSLVAKVSKELEKFYISRDIKSICVSFSGGVDSMVLLYLLSKLKSINVIAFHLNYGNRETADAESQFCNLIAKTFGVSIVVRNITEIKRQRDIDRQIYEDVTRQIRFGCYYKIQNSSCRYTISLGHNYDDCLENIVSNITKQQKLENLCGMTAESVENNVDITRPFLELSKADIYEIADVCGLPYLYDSTPKWSERGRKRDILFPQLNIFDPRILKGLYTMSKQVNDMAKVFNASVNKNYKLNEYGKNKCYVIYEINSEYYLRATLNAICRDEGMEYFSGKSVVNLWNEINNKKHTSGKRINLNVRWYYKYVEGNDTPHHIYRV